MVVIGRWWALSSCDLPVQLVGNLNCSEQIHDTWAYLGLFLLQHTPSAAKPIFKPCGSLATQKGERRRACKCLLRQAIYNKIWIMYVYSFCPRRLQSSCSLSAYTKRSKRLLFVVLETVVPRLQFFEAHCTVCSERNGSASFTDLWNCLCLFAAHELSSKGGSI